MAMIPNEKEIRKDGERVILAMQTIRRGSFSKLQAACGLEDTRLYGALIYLLRRNRIRQEVCDDGIYYCMNL